MRQQSFPSEKGILSVGAPPQTRSTEGRDHGASSDRRISGAYREILAAGLGISLPMVLLSATLLGLVFRHRVTQTSNVPRTLALPGTNSVSDGAYLVDFSATRLITLASLTSSIAPLLPVFVMTLTSFPAAKRILQSSRRGGAGSLPTPYQLNLFLGFLAGGAGSLWNFFTYLAWRRRERVVGVVKISGLVLGTATLLG